jgi:hypothetical protein
MSYAEINQLGCQKGWPAFCLEDQRDEVDLRLEHFFERPAGVRGFRELRSAEILPERSLIHLILAQARVLNLTRHQKA